MRYTCDMEGCSWHESCERDGCMNDMRNKHTGEGEMVETELWKMLMG